MIEFRASMYNGLPNRIIVHQGSNVGPSFVDIANLSFMDVEHTGIQSHNSLGIGKRYHQPLRETNRKILFKHPKANHSLALAVSVKEMNDTLGRQGNVTSDLVFGELPLPYPKSEQKRNVS